MLTLSLKSNHIEERGPPRGLRLVGGLRRDPALGRRAAVHLGSGPARWAGGRGAPEGGPATCFLRGAARPGCLRLLPRGPSRAERSGVGNLGKEVLIEDDGLRRVFFFLSCLQTRVVEFGATVYLKGFFKVVFLT